MSAQTVAKHEIEPKPQPVTHKEIKTMAVSVFKRLERGGCEYNDQISVINKLIEMITERLCREKEVEEEANE